MNIKLSACILILCLCGCAQQKPVAEDSPSVETKEDIFSRVALKAPTLNPCGEVDATSIADTPFLSGKESSVSGVVRIKGNGPTTWEGGTVTFEAGTTVWVEPGGSLTFGHVCGGAGKNTNVVMNGTVENPVRFCPIEQQPSGGVLGWKGPESLVFPAADLQLKMPEKGDGNVAVGSTGGGTIFLGEGSGGGLFIGQSGDWFLGTYGGGGRFQPQDTGGGAIFHPQPTDGGGIFVGSSGEWSVSAGGGGAIFIGGSGGGGLFIGASGGGGVFVGDSGGWFIGQTGGWFVGEQLLGEGEGGGLFEPQTRFDGYPGSALFVSAQPEQPKTGGPTARQATHWGVMIGQGGGFFSAPQSISPAGSGTTPTFGDASFNAFTTSITSNYESPSTGAVAFFADRSLGPAELPNSDPHIEFKMRAMDSKNAPPSDLYWGPASEGVNGFDVPASSWGGITLRCSGTESAFKNVVIMGAGAKDQPALNLGPPALVQEVAVLGSDSLGVLAFSFAPGSRNLVVAGGLGKALSLRSADAITNLPRGIYHLNDDPVAEVERFDGQTVVFRNRGIPYLQKQTRVRFGHPLKHDVFIVEAGVEYRLPRDGSIEIGFRGDTTTVFIQGTKAQPVRFTSAGPKGASGDWAGIGLDAGTWGTSRFEHMQITHAGAQGIPPLYVGKEVVMSSVSVTQSESDIEVYKDAKLVDADAIDKASPDLAFIGVKAAKSGSAGEPLRLKYAVVNSGTTFVEGAQVAVDFCQSKQPCSTVHTFEMSIDGAAGRIGYLDVALPQDAKAGQSIIRMTLDPKNTLKESIESNNSGFANIQVAAPKP